MNNYHNNIMILTINIMKILAFDIERSGATNEHDTIAIGAAVIDENYKVIDTFRECGYTDETNFEVRCWDEFWSKNLDTLETLRYNGNLSYNERQKEMITLFQAFRAKWETFCRENNEEYVLVSDNNVYDGGFINQMIYDHLPELPIPYSASTQRYGAFHETHSMQKSLLMYVDNYNKNWGYTDRIIELYDVPRPEVVHDHDPANDAANIAFDYLNVVDICNGKIKKKGA